MSLHQLRDRRPHLVGEELQQRKMGLGRGVVGVVQPGVDEVLDVVSYLPRTRTSPDRRSIHRPAAWFPSRATARAVRRAASPPPHPGPTSRDRAWTRAKGRPRARPRAARGGRRASERRTTTRRCATADRAPQPADPATRPGSREGARHRFRLLVRAGPVSSRASCRVPLPVCAPGAVPDPRGGPTSRRLRYRSPSLRAQRMPRPTAVRAGGRRAPRRLRPATVRGVRCAARDRAAPTTRGSRPLRRASAARSSGSVASPARKIVRCGAGTSSAMSVGARHEGAASSRLARPEVTMSRISVPAAHRRGRRESVSNGRPSIASAEPTSVTVPLARARTMTANEQGARDAFSMSTTTAPPPDGVATANTRCTISPPGTRTAVSYWGAACGRCWRTVLLSAAMCQPSSAPTHQSSSTSAVVTRPRSSTSARAAAPIVPTGAINACREVRASPCAASARGRGRPGAHLRRGRGRRTTRAACRHRGAGRAR